MNKLLELKRLARDHGYSFRLHFEECCSGWYIELDALGQMGHIDKSRGDPETAIQDGIDWLSKIND